jgi:hypothetical protein
LGRVEVGRHELFDATASGEVVGHIVAFGGLDDTDRRGDIIEVAGDVAGVGAAGLVAVGDDDDVGAGEGWRCSSSAICRRLGGLVVAA